LDVYAIVDGKRERTPGGPDEVICIDWFASMNLHRRPRGQ
jgi:hypothetical protein